MKQTRRKIEDLNLMDDFLFCEVVAGEQGEQFCRYLIKAICKRKVKDIRISAQSVIQGSDTISHGIRMDLYVDEGGKCLYDFEPDKYTDKKILPKRNRYYRALLDGRLLEAGEEYERLPDVWTIFILSKDPFGENRMCYTVKNMIKEDPNLDYEDGAVSLFLYTKGKLGGSKELSQLLTYMEKSTQENAITSELKSLHNYVNLIKKRKEVGVRYMKSWELERMWRREAREEGLAEGLAEGRSKGLAEGRAEGLTEGLTEGIKDGILQSILELLREIGDVPESLRKKIMEEENPDVLKDWVKLAAKAECFDDFEQNM